MEFIKYEDLRMNDLLYKGYTQPKLGVNFEGCKFMLRKPSESDIINKHMLTSGVCNYIYSEVTRLYGLKSEYVDLVINESGQIMSMGRDFEEQETSRFYSLLDILGSFNALSKTTEIYDIIRVCREFDETRRLGEDSLCELFYNTLMVDYITGNTHRRLSGIGVLIKHKLFTTPAPIFGGSKSFNSYFKRETIVDNMRTSYLYHRAEMMSFNHISFEGSKLCIADLLGFDSKEDGIVPMRIVEKFMVSKNTRIYDIVNRLDFLDEVFKEYVYKYMEERVHVLNDYLN